MPVLADVDGEAFKNPPKEFQEHFVGVSFDAAYIEAADFLNHVFSRVPIPLNSFDGKKILDYGCGWGRMIRLLRNNPAFDKTEIHGCDNRQEALEVCRRSIPNGYFSRCGNFPPTIYRNGFFDLIYAYSVFSHLSEKSHMAWAQELSRIIKPGGFVCVTTQAREFIQVCREYREGTRKIESEWHEVLADSFTDPDAEAKFDSGELLYAPGTDFYGETIVPKKFFEEKWGWLGFDVVDWYNHPDAIVYGAQNRVMLRKR